MTRPKDQPLDVVSAAAAANYGYNDTIEKLPYRLMQEEWDRLVETAGGPNKWVFAPPATADNNPTVKMSPDVLYSAIAYDVREVPLHLSVPVSRDPFWSLTLFEANTDRFFGIDDRDVAEDTFELVILGPGQSAPVGEGDHVAASPTSNGIAIARIVVPNADSLKALDKLRKTATASPVKGG